jgi:hypothetical protein
MELIVSSLAIKSSIRRIAGKKYPPILFNLIRAMFPNVNLSSRKTQKVIQELAPELIASIIPDVLLLFYLFTLPAMLFLMVLVTIIMLSLGVAPPRMFIVDILLRPRLAMGLLR